MIWRFQMFALRLLDYVITMPVRFVRVIKWLLQTQPLTGSHAFQRWLSGLLLLIIDLTPLPFLFECIMDWFKIKTRGLTQEENQLAQTVFKNSLPYNLMGMDTASIPVRKKQTVAYVSFHTVNFDRSIGTETFIHELVHIWQYRKYGSVYISESMWAQHWGGGYNYGGREPLLKNLEIGLQAFNYEQQAEIIEDYFRLKNNMPLQWVSINPDLEGILEKYVSELWAHSSIT